jgi:hypothetical protein
MQGLQGTLLLVGYIPCLSLMNQMPYAVQAIDTYVVKNCFDLSELKNSPSRAPY